MSRAKVSLGIAGAGKWGANHVATASSLGVLGAICDADAALLGKVWDKFPEATATLRFEDMLKMPINAVVIATPAQTHAQLALAAIAAGKHVFVEKPLALSVYDAQMVVAEARRKGVHVFVGHIVLYQAAVRAVLEAVRTGMVGDVHHVRARRASFGRLRFVEDVWWSFAPHDVATMLAIMGEEPVGSSIARHSFATPGIADFAYGDFRFSGGRTAHVEVTWLDPLKSSSLDVFGSGGMLALREHGGEARLAFVPCGVERKDVARAELWRGEETTHSFEREDPLRTELQAFLDLIIDGTRVPTSGEAGLAVVRALSMTAASEPQILHETYERTPA
jgi:UDP-2-acetamido-3-amino-2,3-dideoxy-glucuronate N-acetyltransferase